MSGRCEWCGEAFEMTRPDRRFCCRAHQKKAKARRNYSTEKRRQQYLRDRSCPLLRHLENMRKRDYLTSERGHEVAARYRQRIRDLAAEDPMHPQVVAWRERSRRGWYAREARKRGASGCFTTEELRAQAARQRGRCYWCGEKLGMEPRRDYVPDHVLPLALGGSNDHGNIVAACPACNLSKGAKHPIEWAGVLC